jgi:hypothetical protein
MPSARFESAIPATKRPQTYALDRAATGICEYVTYILIKSGIKVQSAQDVSWM